MIRERNNSDREAVYQLICDLEETVLDKDMFMRILDEQASSKHYVFLVYEHEQQVIGICNIRFENQLHHAGCIGEIMELAVSDTHRSLGIGKQLVAHACDIAKANGCIQMEVSCNQKRIQAHRFYMREGFQKQHYKFTKTLIEK